MKALEKSIAKKSGLKLFESTLRCLFETIKSIAKFIDLIRLMR